MKTVLLILTLFCLKAHASEMTYAEHSARMKHATVSGHNIAYVDEGSGPAVVLLHGIPTSSWMYRKVIPLLVQHGLRVIAPDLLGFGQSQRPSKRSDMLIKNQATILLELLAEKLQLNSWTHVLHDFGGPITWEMMEDSRFHATRLVVMDTFAFTQGFDPGMNLLMRTVMRAGTGIPGVQVAFFHQAFKDMVSTPGVANSKMLNGYCQPMVDGGAASYRTLLFSVNDVIKELPRFQQSLRASWLPTKILWGENDAFLSAKIQMPLIKEALNVSDQDAVVLKGAKHLVADERPEELANAILER